MVQRSPLGRQPLRGNGFNDRDGRPTLPFDTPDAARLEAAWPTSIWPREFQGPDLFLHKGHITNWDYHPEYAEGGHVQSESPRYLGKVARQYCQASSAFACLCLVYCFWIAYADLDGFRIDAAKHMGPEALRTFCDVIREFTQSIGKEHFLLAGEISGGREHAWEVIEGPGARRSVGHRGCAG